MKNIFLLIFCIILFSGCAHNIPNPVQKQKSEKQILIDKANNGDLKAMIKLNQTYLFPQTKEGLELYNKWINIVLKSENIDDILEINRVYYKYKDMFLNGDNISSKLIFRAKELGSKQALFMTITKKISQDTMLNFHDELINKKNQDELITLYNAYIYLARFNEAKRVKKLITKSDKEYYDELSLSDKIYFLNIAYYKSRNDETEFNRILKENLQSKDLELIIDTGLYLYKKARRLKDARIYFEKAIKLNTDDSNIYFYLADIYDRFRENKGLIESTLKKAILMDNYEAAKELLKRYKKQKDVQKYLKLKKELLKLKNAKRALASFLYENKKIYEAYNIYDSLAKNGDKKAILFLAREQKTKEYEFNPEKDFLIEKYRQIILNGKEPYLRTDLKFFQYDEELTNKITQIEIKENNIKTLKRMASNLGGKKAIPYLQKTSSFGDIQSKYILARLVENKEAMAIYEELIELGDKKAYSKLAEFYKRLGAISNKKKILNLYEQAYENGDKSVVDKIIGYYICPDCEMLSDKKVNYYVNEAIKDKNEGFILRLANSYKIGHIALKDKKKALKYFKIAFKINKNPKTKKEIENLQN